MADPKRDAARANKPSTIDLDQFAGTRPGSLLLWGRSAPPKSQIVLPQSPGLPPTGASFSGDHHLIVSLFRKGSLGAPVAADAASRLCRERSGVSKCSSAGSKIDLRARYAGNRICAGSSNARYSQVLSFAGNRQRYRSEPRTDLAISPKIATGLTPSARSPSQPGRFDAFTVARRLAHPNREPTQA